MKYTTTHSDASARVIPTHSTRSASATVAVTLTRLLGGLTRTLNIISTTILLTIVFFCIVTPVAIIRRMAGADLFRLKEFKKSRRSVLITRNHTWSQNDLKNLF